VPPGDPTARPTVNLTLPAHVSSVLARLVEAGHEAALVGGCVRDLLRDEPPGDWDVATSAHPEAVVALFPGSTWENRFGTVTLRVDPPLPHGGGVQVTPYRSEEGYRDRRRPDRVRFGASLTDDLGRRDFTINALAWLPDGAPDPGVDEQPGRLVDPHGGAGDLKRGVLRAVGDPDRRLDEDALRLLRGVRFITRFALRLAPATEEAMRRHAPTAATLSGERLREELFRILALIEPPPSAAVRLMERLGLLAVVLPELAALRGVPQGKPLPGDALDHSLRTLDALPADDPVLRLAGLLHDLGKATTLADGHFHRHELVGAELAAGVCRRLRCSRAEASRVTGLVRHHMFAYAEVWTDAAVRRFIRRVGPDAIADLFALRRADDEASGAAEPGRASLEELAQRVERELRAGPIDTRRLAVDGHDLVDELGIVPGPAVGRILDQLLEAVTDDPTRNDRETLLTLARKSLASGG